MPIQLQRLKKMFNQLAAFGDNPQGGLNRLTYSSDFQQAQKWLQQELEAAGAQVQTDTVGNLFGIYPGRREELLPVATGSHLDSVPNGGKFDGAIGIITALECLKSWHEEHYKPIRPLKLIAFAEEEGSRFGTVCLGSQFMTGHMPLNIFTCLHDNQGKTLHEYLSEMAYSSHTNISQNSILSNYCFVEVHAEQGNILEKKDLSLGIVSSIVGIRHIDICILGKANHAGTTTMNRRQDALVAAAQLVTWVYHEVSSLSDQCVATVGHLQVWPNTENVIPGRVELTVEIRSPNKDTLDLFVQRILQTCKTIEQEFQIQTNITRNELIPPIPLNQTLQKQLVQTANHLNYPFCFLPSWAGHDAMIFAQYIPTAMIFVPSKNGISHSPEEFSDWRSIEHATHLLDKTLRTLSAQ
jgi:hydantoinase/carbamoylase family amidase